MTRVNATFDGEVFRPDEPVSLPPNTRVELTVGAPEPKGSGEPSEPEIESYDDTAPSLAGDNPAESPESNGTGEPYAFLRAAAEANLEGPFDASERLDSRVDLTVGAPEQPEADAPPQPETDAPRYEEDNEPGCFFRVARSLKLDGPPDWSERLDEYLYGNLGMDDAAD